MAGYGKGAMQNYDYFDPFCERNKTFVDSLDESPKIKLTPSKDAEEE